MSKTLHPYIDSVKHDALKRIRDFQSRKHRNESFLAVIDGHKELEWALEHNAAIDTLLATDETAESTAVVECERQGTNIFLTRQSIFKRYFSSSDQDSLAALVKLERAPVFPPVRLALLLEDIIDPGNLGTIIRSARSFGIDAFFGNSMELDWFSKKAIKASRGTHFMSRFHAFTDTKDAISQLKSAGYQIVGTSPHANSLISLATLQAKPTILMVGNEQNGLSEDALSQADLLVRIPMMQGVESLNVAVATGISIYELYFRLVLTMLTNNIKTNLGRNIGVLFQLFPKVLNQDLAQCSPLNANLVIFLMIVKLDGTITREQANEDLMRLGEDPQTALALLQKNGTIVLESDAYRITDKGEQDVAKLWMIVENAEIKIMSVLSEQEQAELRSMLTRLEHQCVDLLKIKGA